MIFVRRSPSRRGGGGIPPMSHDEGGDTISCAMCRIRVEIWNVPNLGLSMQVGWYVNESSNFLLEYFKVSFEVQDVFVILSDLKQNWRFMSIIIHYFYNRSVKLR